jgi:hypothetical protein
MGDRREVYRVLVGRTEEKRYHLEGLVTVPVNATKHTWRVRLQLPSLNSASDRYT